MLSPLLVMVWLVKQDCKIKLGRNFEGEQVSNPMSEVFCCLLKLA